jgi:competence protein ComEC
VGACESSGVPPARSENAPGQAASIAPQGHAAPALPPAPALSCDAGAKMRVRFYDVAQALAVLVELPDGRRVLVDTGDGAKRSGCGSVCETAHSHLMDALARDVGSAPVDLVWLTHPHSDHLGGAVDVLKKFSVLRLADNGRDLDDREVRLVREAALARNAQTFVVEPGAATVPLTSSDTVKLTAVVPPRWLDECKKDRNECSILLRIDYCRSSILFTGDAERGEEHQLEGLAPATLLQVGHHGSETSTSDELLAKVRPRYAVVSSGKPNEGMNDSYCHPRGQIVDRLTTALGGPGARSIRAYDGRAHCEKNAPRPEHWADVPASDRLFFTARDGDVVLTTTGDGVFVRE